MMMVRALLLVLLAMFGGAIPSAAQLPTPDERAVLQRAADADHRRMLDLLGIDRLRPGADGNDPKSPNAANYDEAMAGEPLLPDPLRFEDGRPVRSAADWAQRRGELFELFDREIYGRVPANLPKVRWRTRSVAKEVRHGIPVTMRRLIGEVDNSAFPAVTVNISLRLMIPATAKGPVPVIMQFGFPEGFRFPGAPPSPPNAREWADEILARGWGYAVVVPNSIQEDSGGGLTRGIIGLANRGRPRKPDDWGVLRAWAWGASRALDYLESDPAVDATRVGLEGMSRYGKAALVTMAYDPRFAIGFISSSGEGGAKLHRRDFGERVENLASPGLYHWMAGNFLKYAGPLRAHDLPVDQHELIALVAPRPLFIGAGKVDGDGWVDPRGSFLAAAAAGPVYRLLGRSGLGTDEFPPIETLVANGGIAFRQHREGHTAVPNYPLYLDFAERWFRR
jgi:hypothetical protein